MQKRFLYVVSRSVVSVPLLTAIFCVIIFCALEVFAYSSYPERNYWATNGTVRDIKQRSSYIYLAGDFTYIGLQSGGGAAISSDTANLDKEFPPVHGIVNAIIPDNDGGFFIGGSFNSVGYENRQNLAHILSDGTVDWNLTVGVNAQVTALALSPDGKTLYAGGSFTKVSGIKRQGLAAINLSSNTLNDWTPSVAGDINAMALSPDGSALYLGGSFTKVNGETRNRLAALSTTDASLMPWNPNASATVNTIALSLDGGAIYVGGQFTKIFGQTRKHLAGFSPDGALLDFDPAPNSNISKIIITPDNRIFVAGAFTNICGIAKKYLAALDASGSCMPWTAAVPNAAIEDFAISPDNASIYICGNFTSVASAPRRFCAALELFDGSLKNWTSSFDSAPSTVAVSSDSANAYFGGSFSLCNGEIRNRLAAINTNTDSVSPWNPNANGSVIRMEFSPNKDILYLGGAFTAIGGETRNYIAAVNSQSGALSSWNPKANGVVRDLKVSSDGKSIYAAGDFTQIGGQPRRYIASLGSVSGTAYAWDPSADAPVMALEISPDDKIIYAGGKFKNIGKGALTYLAAIEAETATAKAWNAPANNAVFALALSSDGKTLYAGGAFTKCLGRSRNRLAAISAANGIVTDWNPGANANVNRLVLAQNGQTIFAGGTFSTTGGANRPYGANISCSTSQATAWNPLLNNICLVFGISGDGEPLFAGGSFTSSNSQSCACLAAYQKGIYHLSVVNGSGDGNYAQGYVVNINADIPPEGHYFTQWTGATSYLSNPKLPSTKLAMPASNISVTANYKPITYTVKFVADINGKISGSSEQKVQYGKSTSSVKAVPDIDYKFVNWTGDGFISTQNPLKIKDVKSDMTITANFAPIGQTAELMISASPAEGGICEPSGAVQTMLDRPLFIGVIPETGWHFVSWQGSQNVSIANPTAAWTSVTISGAGELTANFAKTPETAEIIFASSPENAGSTTPSGAQSVPTETQLEISATANEGYYFYAWEISNASAIIENALIPKTQLTAYGDCTVTAVFKEIPPDTFVSYGKIYNLEAKNVPIANFAKAPNAYGQYEAAGKTAKSRLKSMSKFTGQPLANCDLEWSGKIALLNQKVWNENKTLTCLEILDLQKPSPLDVKLFASATASSGESVKDKDTGIVLSEQLPQIYGVFDVGGREIAAAVAGQQIFLRGIFFGKSPPSAWLEYKDKNGNVNKLALKVDKKNLPFDDYSGKPNKSCMEIFTGQSSLLLYFPTKWPKGWTHIGEHNIVIDNKICRASIKFMTAPD